MSVIHSTAVPAAAEEERSSITRPRCWPQRRCRGRVPPGGSWDTTGRFFDGLGAITGSYWWPTPLLFPL